MEAKRLRTEFFCAYLFAFLSDSWILLLIRRDPVEGTVAFAEGRILPAQGVTYFLMILTK